MQGFQDRLDQTVIQSMFIKLHIGITEPSKEIGSYEEFMKNKKKFFFRSGILYWGAK